MLPTPPPPRPARRDATIDLALRRFDGEPDPVAPRPAPGRAGWVVGGLRQRPAGLLASVLIVAAIGVPATLVGLRDQQPVDAVRERSAAAPSAPAGDAAQVADSAAEEASSPTGPSGALPVTKPASPVSDAPRLDLETSGLRERSPDPEARNVASPAFAAPAPSPPPPPPPPPPAARAPDTAGQAASEVADAMESGEVVVTGSRRAETAAKNTNSLAEEALDLRRRSAPGYVERALAKQRRGDWRGALADLDRAYDRDPRNPAILRARALVRRQLGDTRRAEADDARAAILEARP